MSTISINKILSHNNLQPSTKSIKEEEKKILRPATTSFNKEEQKVFSAFRFSPSPGIRCCSAFNL
jgi:hypothetical protein